MGLFDGVGSQLPTERLMTCSANGDIEGLRTAIADGADSNYRRTDMSALLLALSRSHEDCALLLLTTNINVNVKNSRGWRPLHEAVLKGFPAVVDQLIELGATVTARDETGVTALRVAANAGHTDLAARLLDEGAAIDAPDLQDVTALMTAVERRDTAMMDLLIDRGADPMRQDQAHRSAVDRAAGWVDGETRFQNLLQARHDAEALLLAAKAQDVGMSTIAKRRRPG